MRKLTWPVLVFAVVLAFAAPAAQAQEGAVAQLRAAARPNAAAWGIPAVIYPATWPNPLRFSLDDRAERLAALIPASGSDDKSRHIVVSERSGAAWQPPVVIAQNGAYSDAPFQVLPQQTHPVLSGDGGTVAYVGWTGSTFGAYIVDRLPGGGWGTPALVPAGLPNVHYRISLSGNGDTLALADYPFFGVQNLYVITRQGGVWAAPVLIGPGGNPALAPGGARLTYVSNGQVYFAETTAASWTAPQALTDNDPSHLWVEYPQLSGDGNSIYYWLVTLVPQGSSLLRTAQDLYVLRRDGDWGAPQKVNAEPVLPSSVTEGPAAADRYATRLIYTRPVTATDPLSGEVVVTSSHLDSSEGVTTTWRTQRVVAANGDGNYNKWPRLTPDGKTLVFDGGISYASDPPVYGALWQMTTTVAPPAPPWSLSVTTLVGPAGGSLFAPIDGINYVFGPNAFTTTVTVTHVSQPPPLPAPPPSGQVNIGGIGGGLGGGFLTTLLGPGGLPIQPAQPVTVTVSYAGAPPPVVPGSLGLWRLEGSQWAPLPGEDDAVAQLLTAQVDHFSQFAVFGETRPLFLPYVVR